MHVIYQKYIKRLLDIVISGIVLLICIPLLAVLAIMVRVKLGCPIIFKQERIGLHEKIFTLYKFRTMTDEWDAEGRLLSDSERLTAFGMWLRSTSLDELPELWNILKGDMSLVGPRPLLVRYLPYYLPEEHQRHEVRPGLTGLAQIADGTSISWEDKFQKDINYVNNCSFRLDITIVLKTILVVFNRKDTINDGIEPLDVIRKK